MAPVGPAIAIAGLSSAPFGLFLSFDGNELTAAMSDLAESRDRAALRADSIPRTDTKAIAAKRPKIAVVGIESLLEVHGYYTRYKQTHYTQGNAPDYERFGDMGLSSLDQGIK